MARTLDAKCKVCRRAGVKLFLKGERCFTPKCAIVKRNYPPGAQGAKKGKSRLTGYGTQLREKQKAKQHYRVSETQFRRYFDTSVRRIGNTGDNMIQLLEMRLDNVVFRLGWAKSHDHARQLVSHGHLLVNGKKVNIPSYQVEVGSTLAISGKAIQDPHFKDMIAKLEKVEAPGWLFGERTKFEGKVVAKPTLEETAPLFDMKSIIEFYSR